MTRAKWWGAWLGVALTFGVLGLLGAVFGVGITVWLGLVGASILLGLVVPVWARSVYRTGYMRGVADLTSTQAERRVGHDVILLQDHPEPWDMDSDTRLSPEALEFLARRGLRHPGQAA